MGYYTKYRLEADPWPAGLAEAIEQDRQVSYAIDPDGSTAESATWYEHRQDMADLSRRFPGVLFTLHGTGEEPGDIWTEYYRDGRVQVEKARIVIDPFDPAKLTEPPPRER